MSLQYVCTQGTFAPKFSARFREAIGFANTNPWKNRISTRNPTPQSAQGKGRGPSPFWAFDLTPVDPQPQRLQQLRAQRQPLCSFEDPSLRVSLYASYAHYLDGQQIGSAGNLQGGNFCINPIGSFAVANSGISSGSSGRLRLPLRIGMPGGFARFNAAPGGVVAGAPDARLRIHGDSAGIFRLSAKARCGEKREQRDYHRLTHEAPLVS